MPNGRQRDLVVIMATVLDSANSRKIITDAKVTATPTNIQGAAIDMKNNADNVYKGDGENTTSYKIVVKANGYADKTKNISPTTGYSFKVNMVPS